jgi:alkylhydroperoxidase family enzyme
VQAALARHFSDSQIVELALGVGLFLGMSKVLITLGLEPDEMAVTVIPTPGSGG